MFRRREQRETESKLIESWIENFFLKKKLDNMEKAMSEIIRAIEDNGPVPQYHQHVMRKHRSEWPSLWAAIDNAIVAYRMRNMED